MRAERKNASGLMDSEHQVDGKVENKTGYDEIWQQLLTETWYTGPDSEKWAFRPPAYFRDFKLGISSNFFFMCVFGCSCRFWFYNWICNFWKDWRFCIFQVFFFELWFFMCVPEWIWTSVVPFLREELWFFLSFSCRGLTERILWEILKACIKKNGGSDRKKIKDL